MNKTNKPNAANFLIDEHDEGFGPVKVFILEKKESMKQYCHDSGLDFKEGFRRFYNIKERKWRRQ